MVDCTDKENCGHYKDIIDCIQDRVDKIIETEYASDDCLPIAIVSVLWKNNNEQTILLNLTHLGRTFSRVLFPVKDGYWGYDYLGDMIRELYNQTM